MGLTEDEEVKEKPGTVFLVGAGPGDPGLITVKGLRCLREAEVVVYDLLANPLLLEEAPPRAERIFVGKSRGFHPTPQEKINELLVERARRGKKVVRLKGGDPYIFGRGGEEAQYLVRHGIPFEVVPGITAAFAAAAYAGIPITHRDYTTSVGLVTGHMDPEKKMTSLDWEKLAGAVGTLAFYMGMANLPLISSELIRHGRSPQTPVAVISWGTTPRQRTLVATLGDVVERVEGEGITPPAIILVGEVVSLRQELRWFDRKPLLGKRVLVTRASAQGRGLAELLEERGCESLLCPVIEILPPDDSGEMEAAIASLAGFDYVILTSANGVDFFWSFLRAAGRDARALSGPVLVAVGPKTALALEAHGLHAELVADEFRAEGVVDLLRRREMAGKRVLYPRGDRARQLIPRELDLLGATVVSPVAYRTVLTENNRERILELLRQEKIDAVTFTSASTVEDLVQLIGEDAPVLLKKVTLASIGPLTSAALKRLGLSVAVEAELSTMEGLVTALENHYKKADQLPSGD
ncbi:MAG: uroporphyrinogen-III C-methyltransferase [Desulfuromonadaceae bacterium]|nr:uroporphyrinogen-III C-methyltransferase [Desulfuromonadaceae bacterium]